MLRRLFELTLATTAWLALSASAEGQAPPDGSAEADVTTQPKIEAPTLWDARPRVVMGLPEALQPILQQDFELWANPHGGREQDLVYTGLLQFGVRVDLGEAGWVPGLSMGALGVWVQGDNLSQTGVGDAGIVSNIAGVDTVRLFKLWLRQRWWNGVLDIKGGLIPADDDFMVLDSALLFMHSSFGTLQSTALNIPVGIYPLASLGVRAIVRPNETWEARLGAYDGDAGHEAEHPHIADLAVNKEQGATLFAELTWRGQLAERRARVTWGGFAHLGLVHDHLDLFDQFTDTRRDRGLGNVYVMLEQELARFGGSLLTAFIHGSVAFPTRRAVVPWYADGGLLMGGTAWGRPADNVGLGYAWTGFGDPYLLYSRVRGDDVSEAESVLELTYRLSLLPWVALQPCAQWLFDPHFAKNDAFVLALRLRVEA